MSEKKLITVVVPVYNTGELLRECVDSILAQTYKNLEIILVDDGSTDSSGEICDQYSLKDSRISVYHQKNSGQASARNYALSIARGEYVGFVDSDDYIAPNMYETMVDSLERNDADIVVCGRLMVRGEVATVAQMFHMDKETVFENREAVERFFTYKRVDSSPTDKLYKRDIISDIKFPLGYICEDIPFVYDAISRANKVVHCGHEFYYYRVREGSTSRSGFSVRGMGLYYNAKTVYDKSIVEYPELKQEIEFFLVQKSSGSRLPYCFDKFQIPGDGNG